MVETRRCGAVAVRSQLITWSSALTLYALYLSRPFSPPPPSHQLRPFFLRPGRLSPPLFTLTRGIQGCPKTISFDKSTWHPTFEKTFPILFFFAAWRPYIFATPFAKNALPSSPLNNPRILSRSFFCCSFLPFLNPLPHGVLATFFLTAGGFMSPPIKDDISRKTTILMTSLRTHRTSAVSSPGLYYNYPPSPLVPLRGHCIHIHTYIHIMLQMESNK